MAGPAKQRAQKEKQQQQATRSSNDSSASRDPTQRSINKYDGNKDPHGHGAGVLEYTRLNDLKNLSEFLGMAGWYTARGVSANALSQSIYAYIHTIQTLRSRVPASHRVDAWLKYPPQRPFPSVFHIQHTSVPPRKIPHSCCTSTCVIDILYFMSSRSSPCTRTSTSTPPPPGM